MKKIFIGLSVMIFLFSCLTSAAVYYVDATGGDDSNDGLSPETAWQTIGKVNSHGLKTGDDILFKRGETFNYTVYINMKHGGTVDDPVIIGAYGQGPKPIITTPFGGVSSYQPNLAYIIVQDLDIRNADGGQSVSFGADNLSNITIRRLNIDGNANRNGILLTKIDTYLVENCTISNIGNSGIAIIGTPTYPITDGVIRNNVISNVRGNDCITLHKNGEGDDIGPNHLLVNNVGYNCSEEAYDLTSGDNITLINNKGYANGICSISIGHEPSNIWIDRYYAHDEPGVGICIGTAYNVKITNSVFYHTAYGITISNTKNFEGYHNTFVFGPETSYGVDIGYSDTEGVIFKNNIFTSTTNRPGRYIRFLSNATINNTNTVFENNIWWRADGGQTGDNRMWYLGEEGLVHWDGWQERFPTDRFVDPELVDPQNRDLHLQPRSPAIDAGLNMGLIYDFEGNLRLQGSAPDIGAFEFKGSAQVILGDLNRDGVVDIQDLSIVGTNFGLTSGFDNRADTDNNNEIDIFDIVFVASRFT